MTKVYLFFYEVWKVFEYHCIADTDIVNLRGFYIGQDKQNAISSMDVIVNVVSVCSLFEWHVKFVGSRVKAQLAQARLLCKLLLQL